MPSVFRSEDDGLAFSYPAGDRENVHAALDYLLEYFREKGLPFCLYNVTPEHFEELERWYPEDLKLSTTETRADYVYETEKLATLGRKKLHGKRNHINKFKALYPDWSYEPLDDGNVEECFQVALKWRNQNGCDEDEEKNCGNVCDAEFSQTVQGAGVKRRRAPGGRQDCGLYRRRAAVPGYFRSPY